ncbi:MAG: 23S rRNA (guanosine(2251)-2'-O)-methyltransferase RlmB [Rickettsiales bacterium]
MKKVTLFGKHSILSALQNKNRRIFKVFLLKDSARHIEEQAVERKIDVTYVNKEFLDKVTNNSSHQGVAAECETVFKKFSFPDSNDEEPIVILDQITDIQNIGSIIRSAYAFGIRKVVIPSVNSPNETGAISKLSVGCIDQVSVEITNNIARTTEMLKKSGYWVIGLDSKGETNLNNFDFPKKSVIILGSEGTGIRTLVRNSCDFLVKIPMQQDAESLNVSCAATVVFNKYFTHHQ